MARSGDADDHAHAPAAVAAFQRLPHDSDIAGAVEGVVGAADLIGACLCHVDQMRDQIAASFLWINEMRHSETLAPFLPGIINVNADNHVGAC